MAKPYDGTAFVRIHDDAVSPVDVGSGIMSSRPLDTWLENAIRSQGLYCARPGSQVSWSPICAEASQIEDKDATRPYASLAPGSILYLPWIVTPGLKRIELSALARCGIEGSGFSPLTTWIELEGQLTAFGLAGRGPALFAPPSGSYEQRDLSLDLVGTAPATAITNLRWVIVSGKSGYSLETPGDGALKSLNRLDAGSSASTFYEDDLTDPAPNATSLDVRATFDGSSGAAFDHLTTRSEYEPVLFDGQRCTVRPVSGGPVQSPGRLGRGHLSYLQVKGCEIADFYEPTQFVREQRAYRAQVPIDARDEYQHLLTWRALHQRPRCLWIGPTGEVPPADDSTTQWPPAYHRRFPLLQHDGESDPTRFFWLGFKPQTKNPRLKLLLNVIPFARALGVAAADLSALADLAPTCEWTVKIEVFQYQDGDISPAPLNSATRARQPLTHWPTDGGGGWAFLLQERIKALNIFQGDFSNKEGMLFQEDLALVQRLEVDLQIAYDPAGAHPGPLMALVSLERDNNTLVRPPVGDETYWDPSIADNLVISCVGATLWELPLVQDYPIPPLGDWTHPGKIRAADWLKVIRAADVHFRRLGGRSHLLFPSGRAAGPGKFTTTLESPLWATNNEGGALNADMGLGLMRLSRPIGLAADQCYFRLRGFLSRCRVRVHVEGADGSPSDLITLENTSLTPEWVEESLYFDVPDDRIASNPANGKRLFRFWFEVQSTGGGEGTMYQLELQEEDQVIDAALPDGS